MIHIEDTSVLEFIDILRHFNTYIISEKIDGSNLIFGIENNRLYTSRSGKNTTKYFDINDYPVEFHTTFQRSAHLALQQIVPVLIRNKLLLNNDSIEIEVLYGELPNVVRYSNDSNKIVILKNVSGNANLNAIQKIVHNTTTEFTMQIPVSVDGKHIQYTHESQKWTFNNTPSLKGVSIEKTKILKDIIPLLSDLEDLLSKQSGVWSFTNSELIAFKLNKRPYQVPVEKWKELRVEIKSYRESLSPYINEKKLQIKKILLAGLVRKTKSAFGPDIKAGGWIEGVVCYNPDTKKSVKIVDKDVFLRLKNFLWYERDYVSAVPRNIDEKHHSLIGHLRVDMGDKLGDPLYGTTQCKRKLREFGDKPEDAISFFSNIFPDAEHIDSIKRGWVYLVDQTLDDLDSDLSSYKALLSTTKIEIEHLGTFVYDKEVDDRTRCVYAAAKQRLELMLIDIKKAETISDLMWAYIGKQLSEI